MWDLIVLVPDLCLHFTSRNVITMIMLVVAIHKTNEEKRRKEIHNLSILRE